MKSMGKLAFGINDPRVQEFVKQVGPQILADMKESPYVIVSNGGGGLHYGLALYGWLTTKEYKGRQPDVEFARLKSEDDGLLSYVFDGKTIVFVDDGINTGKAFRKLSERFEEEFRPEGAAGMKFAAPFDKVGHYADYTCGSKFTVLDMILHPVDATAEYIDRALKYLKGAKDPPVPRAPVMPAKTGKKLGTNRRNFIIELGVFAVAAPASEKKAVEYVSELFGRDKA